MQITKHIFKKDEPYRSSQQLLSFHTVTVNFTNQITDQHLRGTLLFLVCMFVCVCVCVCVCLCVFVCVSVFVFV
ncbi:hypothetical protein Y032_0774g2246 [Ancylostoma ceylanicum]|uniref:Uncharacterized protein n=1 Tax=Ancylostoma ceylanicum TaxID=53326 RepID=A0A016WEF0_9BILA|nr:hypothetical protein Y032_0774g2246 [Ancylostoma ceylanicum]